MYDDILNGVDIHCVGAAFLSGESYDTHRQGYLDNIPERVKQRKIAKSLTFLLQYGGGAEALFLSTGVPKDTCSSYIRNYYERYKVLAQWQEDNMRETRDNFEQRHVRVWSDIQEKWVEKTLLVGKLRSITGRVYTFNRYATPEFIRDAGGPALDISPTQVKNYPSQGFATGDIVPMMIGVSYRRLLASGRFRDKALHIGTVHDSILYDVHDDVLYEFCPGIKKLMQKTPEFIQKTFGFEFNLPLLAEVEVGRRWDSMQPYEEIQ
jgi:DNA polymerase I-like protein with 3'-5' exonuclease and polymerase domains